MSTRASDYDFEPVVVTGLGLITAVGQGREESWAALRAGKCGVRPLTDVRWLDEGEFVGASVAISDPLPGQAKAIPMSLISASEAIEDSQIDLDAIDRTRFAVASCSHMGDTTFCVTLNDCPEKGVPDSVPWWEQFLPNSACTTVANKFGLYGPRLCFSTACASGLIGVLNAVRTIQTGQADMALAGGCDMIDPLCAAGFRKMKALSANVDNPTEACRPFDRNRDGFVLGEGGAYFVLERLSHARARGARIYSEILGGKELAEAFHVTGLDDSSDTLEQLIRITLESTGLVPSDIGYVSAHGTGTLQNDRFEMLGIRDAFGKAVDSVSVSASKSMVGHMVNAAGSSELAITTLALRDGFLPPTLNLTDPDPDCVFDCVPQVGRRQEVTHALKLSVAFGGHLVGVTMRRWDGPDARASILS